MAEKTTKKAIGAAGSFLFSVFLARRRKRKNAQRLHRCFDVGWLESTFVGNALPRQGGRKAGSYNSFLLHRTKCKLGCMSYKTFSLSIYMYGVESCFIVMKGYVVLKFGIKYDSVVEFNVGYNLTLA